MWEDSLWEMLTQKLGKRIFPEKSNTAESQLIFFFLHFFGGGGIIFAEFLGTDIVEWLLPFCSLDFFSL